MVASAGRLTVLDSAPDTQGWIAAIIRTWPIAEMDRSPIAQSKTT